jgi:alpha-L-rhamnosidase
MKNSCCMLASILLVTLSPVARGELAAPVKLVVSEGFENPIGFYDATPTFSWQLPADGSVKAQTGYHIVAATSAKRLVGKADLWDSGKVESDQSVWIPYAGKALTSGQGVHWRVKFWDEKGRESAWSAPARFELGLLENSDWKGSWIRMRETEGLPENTAVDLTTGSIVKAAGKVKAGKFAPEYFRREFMLKGGVQSARLHVTAKGLYEVYLNGSKVGKDFMVPGWTPYHARIETLTYDVTDRLQKGGNTVGAIVGEGYGNGHRTRARQVCL